MTAQEESTDRAWAVAQHDRRLVRWMLEVDRLRDVNTQANATIATYGARIDALIEKETTHHPPSSRSLL